MKKDSKFFIILAFVLFSCALLLHKSAAAETVSLPLSIDSQLLRSMVIKTAYTDGGRTADLTGHPGGCDEVILSEPTYSIRGNRIYFETKVFLQAGFGVGSTCLVPVTWEGYVAITQVPVMDDQWTLSFRVLDSAVYNQDHEPARIMNLFWRLIETHVLDYLSHITFNLTPPVEDLRLFAGDLFPPRLHDRAQRMMDSLRPGKVQAQNETVTVEILADVEEGAGAEKDLRQPLDEEEAAKFMALWESWDAYFVKMITSLPKEHLSSEEKKLILDVLLDTRHRFEDRLLERREDEDFVRQEFITAWERLSPLFKRRMTEDPARPLMDYLGFFTASDALIALDNIGPSLGIEISRAGLIHLARLISSSDVNDLSYDSTVDADLREVLGLGNPLPFTEPSFDGDSIQVDPEEFVPEENDWTMCLKTLLVGTAWAKTDPKDNFRDHVTPWLVPKGEIQPYLKRIRSILTDASSRVFLRTDLDQKLTRFYNLLVLSTAWQETCFRQFVVEGGKATYLKSYNRTSVGIMQVNERVWRGVYDINHLRWDILYNATAGCEILGIYLKNYALPGVASMALEKRADQEILARVAYALYSGGPSQLQGFIKRLSKGDPGAIDGLFREKYNWVCGEKWEKIEVCL